MPGAGDCGLEVGAGDCDLVFGLTSDSSKLSSSSSSFVLLGGGPVDECWGTCRCEGLGLAGVLSSWEDFGV